MCKSCFMISHLLTPQIAAAAAATERAFGSEYFQDRSIISESTSGRSRSRSDSIPSLCPPDDPYAKYSESPRGSVTRSNSERHSRGKSSRDKSPRPSPMETRQPKKRQPPRISASYRVITKLIFIIIRFVEYNTVFFKIF